MAQVFLGSLMLVPYNFAPQGWAICAGQILPISQNTALFSLLGTYYGGDGRTNFALPNLQGQIPIGMGQGPGLSLYDLGESGGANPVTLIVNEVPPHSHGIQSASQLPSGKDPANAGLAEAAICTSDTSKKVAMNAAAIKPAGGSQPHNNLMPYLTLTWIIALQGI